MDRRGILVAALVASVASSGTTVVLTQVLSPQPAGASSASTAQARDTREQVRKELIIQLRPIRSQIQAMADDAKQARLSAYNACLGAYFNHFKHGAGQSNEDAIGLSFGYCQRQQPAWGSRPEFKP